MRNLFKKVIGPSLALLIIAILGFTLLAGLSQLGSSGSNINPAVQDNVQCTRNEPYQLSPELERARSLFFQRIESNNVAPNAITNYLVLDKYAILKKYANCINITYTTEADAHAYFIIQDKEDFNPNNVLVYFNVSRLRENDIENSVLFAHEMSHVADYLLSTLANTEMPDCRTSEQGAYYLSYYFWSNNMNSGEFGAIASYPMEFSDIVTQVRLIGKRTIEVDLFEKYSCVINDVACFEQAVHSEVGWLLSNDAMFSNVCVE